LVLVGTGLGARLLAARAWTALVGYQTPFGLRTPEARPAPPLVDHVVMVLVDGLAYHASRAMPFLNVLRAKGADLECSVGLPSLSLPGRSVLMSGAWQEVHGQTTNFNPRPLPVEHIFATAKRRGLATALAAGTAPQTLFSPYVDERVVYPRLDKNESVSLDRLSAELLWMGETTRGLLRDKHPGFFLMDYTIADEAGHGWGAASPQYARAAAAVDDEIRKLAAEIDLRRTVLIVTSDHGHTAAGARVGRARASRSTWRRRWPRCSASPSPPRTRAARWWTSSRCRPSSGRTSWRRCTSSARVSSSTTSRG
jgi:type I phosphodiesterase/nucleotide pyrophosphatase